MTRVDIYKYAKDKEIIGNYNWKTDYKYVRLGFKFFRLHDLVEINILDESNQNDTDFTICGKISKFEKFKIRFSLVIKLLRQTK
jgi:hypothetical protein